MIKFLLNNEDKPRELTTYNVNTTILEFLREEGFTGTKEGCASGDCGACTVVIASLDQSGQKIHYETLNSCITPVYQLAGKQLISVEGLQEGKNLHPVQQAMVQKHGSQCGYCTPGFIMSLFGLFKNKQKIDKPSILEALGGNLCRCTGYRPIIDAALSLKPAKDNFNNLTSQTIKKLQGIAQKKIDFYPQTISDLTKYWQKNPDSRLIRGGTDLMLAVTQKYQQFSSLIFLDQIKELTNIQENSSDILIGSAVSLTKVSIYLQKYFSSFSELFHRFASLQIRNRASIGGNLANASAIADTPPALLALNASLILRQKTKIRKIALQDFFTGYRQTLLQPQEFIEQIIIPKKERTSFKIYKVSKRFEDDISALCGSFSLVLEKDNKIKDILIAYCGLSAFPKLAKITQKFLQGKKWNEENVTKALEFLEQDYQPITDFRATQNYRTQVCKNLLYKFYIQSTL